MTYGKIFAALADDTRRGIFEELRETPLTVSELAADQAVSRPAVSQHLKVLQDSGLVSVKPVGTRRIYSINTDGLALLRDYLDSYWTDVLKAYEKEIQSSVKRKTNTRRRSNQTSIQNTKQRTPQRTNKKPK